MKDAPPERIRVKDRDSFLTLHEPGAYAVAYVLQLYVEGSRWCLFAGDSDLKIGDQFRVRLAAVKMDWWNWETKDGKLMKTHVWLPS